MLKRIATVLTLVLVCVTQSAFAQTLPTAADTRDGNRDRDSSGVLRRAALDIDFEFIRMLSATRRGSEIKLTLFDDVSFTARTVRIEYTDAGFDWFGTIPSSNIGDIMLSVADGALTGTVWIDHTVFNIHATPDAGYVVDQTDTAAFRRTQESEDKDDVQDPTIALRRLNRRGVVASMLAREAIYNGFHARLRARAEAGIVPEWVLQRFPEPGSRVDVYFGVTVEAAEWLERNHYDPIPALKDLVRKANTAFTQSGIATQLNYVGMAILNGYAQAGDNSLKAELRNLRGAPLQPQPHPDLSILHVLRDAVRADVVTLLTFYPTDVAGRACGRSTRLAGPADFQATPITAGGNGPSASVGFNVVSVDCAVLDHSYTHEIGHTFGAAHDNYRFDDEFDTGIVTTPAMPGGHGFILTEPNVRTVMAYDDFCVDILGQDPDEEPCPVIPRFSNPQQTYSGAVLGLPVGFGSFDAANNVAVINLTARTVANFRHAFY